MDAAYAIFVGLMFGLSVGLFLTMLVLTVAILWRNRRDR